MAMRAWFTIPKKVTVDRDDGELEAVKIQQGYGSPMMLMDVGIDGGLTLDEAEDLQWRLKQGIQLLKQGKIRNQRT